jgi:hypothetical protein
MARWIWSSCRGSRLTSTCSGKRRQWRRSSNASPRSHVWCCSTSAGQAYRIRAVPTLEQRVDDVRAVLDACGSERGGAVRRFRGRADERDVRGRSSRPRECLDTARRDGRTTEAPDYPWASPADALRESAAQFIAPYWGRDARGTVELFAPSLADDPRSVELVERLERSAASPAMVWKIFEMFLDIDVRAILPAINVPTLVLHRRGDRIVNWRAGRELASQIPGARYVELPGIDHLPGPATRRGPRGGRGVPHRNEIGT